MVPHGVNAINMQTSGDFIIFSLVYPVLTMALSAH